MADLRGQIALVTGASRGAGRGIARVLGEAGATVYVTGRSVRGAATTENLPGTVDETGEEVTARGGHGIAVRCDHTVDADVEALFARIKKDHGRLDILVNNVWGGYEEYHRKIPFLAFWKPPFAERWQRVFGAGLRAHLHASALAAPLMIPQKRGLIVSTIAWDHDKFLGAVFYDLPKHALVRMIYGMAHELRKHNVAAIALAPGFMRTERVLATPASDWPGGKIDLSLTESPEYTGRAVRALATDPKVMEKSGRAFLVGEIAQEYGFTDIDGRKIPPFTVPES
jgi:NAD(P)-dependent dehydrogenase (short-subunit alcohol dehydrogenase family)